MQDSHRIARPGVQSLLRGRRQAGEQAARVPATAVHRLHVGVELIDQCRDRQARAVAGSLGEDDAEVLAHPVDREPVRVLTVEHGLVAVLHLPRLRGALGDDVDHRAPVETGGLGEVQALGEPLHQPGDADLVDHLGQLPRPALPEQPHRAAVVAHRRLGPGERRLLAPDHDRQHTVLGTRLTTRDRGVEEGEAVSGGGGVQLAGERGGGGGVIDEHAAPSPIAPNAPLSPVVTLRTSSSLPTQQKAMSTPSTAAAGVSWASSVPVVASECSATQSCARARRYD